MRFPEFEGEWERCRLENIANFSKGTGISKDQLSTEGNPCILYGELYTTYKSEVIDEIFSKTNIDSENLVVNQANDVIIPCSGETAIDISTARCILLDNVLLGGDLNIIRLKNGNGSFLSYQMNSKRKLDIARIAQGAAIVHLHNEHLKKVYVCMPEQVEEQNKITSLLRLIDQCIETQSQIIEDLELLRKATIGQFSHRFRTSKISISEILLERNEKSSVNNQYDILSSTTNGIYKQRDYFDKHIASENNIGYRVIRQNDLVLSPQNLWMGNINYNSEFEIGIVSPSYKVFKIRKGFDKAYIAYLLKTHRALYSYMTVSEQGASIVRRNLNMEAFYEITFEIPKEEHQTHVGNFIKSLQNKIDVEKNLLANYKTQKKVLLSKMFI